MSHALTASSATADASDRSPAASAGPEPARAGGMRAPQDVGRGVVALSGVTPTTSLEPRGARSRRRSRERSCGARRAARWHRHRRGPRRLAQSAASVVGVERGARLVERDHASRARAGAGRSRARRRRAAPGRPRGPRPARRATASGSRSPARRQLERRGDERAVGCGIAERDVRRAIVPAISPGCWPAHASHVDGARSRDVGDRRRSRVPVELGAAPRSAARTLDLPAPLGPSISGDRARLARPATTGGRARSPRLHARRPARTSVAPAVARRPAPRSAPLRAARRSVPRAASSTSKTSSVAATPSAAAWNCTPTWRSGRYASGASSSTNSPTASVERAVEQPEPDRHGDDRDRDAREELEREPREERDPQHLHRLAPVVVGDALDGCRGPVLPAEHLERRQSPCTVSAKRAARRCRVCHWRCCTVARRQADQHHEERDEGEREQHGQAARSSPATTSRARSRASR